MIPLLLSGALAWAGPAEEPPPLPDPDWIAVEHRSKTVATTGVLATGAGLGLFVLTGVPFLILSIADCGSGMPCGPGPGLALGFGLSATGLLLGPPLLLGGSLRYRTALMAQGMEVPVWAGASAVGLDVLAVGLFAKESLGSSQGFALLGGLGALGLSTSLGLVQLSQDGLARRAHPLVVAPVLVPGGVGVGAGGSF